MNSLLIFALLASFFVFVLPNPMSLNGINYDTVRGLGDPRTRRDVFLDRGDQVPSPTSDGPNQGGKIAKYVVLKRVSPDNVLHRTRRAQYDYNGHRYLHRNDYFDDSDDAGHDRRGSDVGYMDDDDDFPTVVW